MKQTKACEAFEWLESISCALAATLVLLVFFANFSNVKGASMWPTLHEKDQVLNVKLFYTPQYGDIITTDARIAYGKPLVKRVIAMEGDTVDITKDGVVMVNGVTQAEAYLGDVFTQPGEWVYPITVPEGCVFAMGDNRPNSVDSRTLSVGFVDMREIVGKVAWRVAPFASMGKIL